MDENTAAILNENLARITLPQLSSQEQFRLADTIECVATVEKHRRSMDDNAARYLLFFRQHILRRTQGVTTRDTVSWREIVWAFHSGSQDILSDLVSKQFGGKMTWRAARESGIFMWLSDHTAIVSIPLCLAVLRALTAVANAIRSCRAERVYENGGEEPRRLFFILPCAQEEECPAGTLANSLLEP